MKSLDPAIRKRLLVGLLLVVGLMLLLTAIKQFQGPRQAARPRLGLMTTLPLQWPEGTIATAVDEKATPAPAYSRLAGQYRIVPIDTVKQLDAEKPQILLMAQSRALAPRELVALDAWVRKGGRALILADPALQWESIYPVGDSRRPLFTTLLTPLFAHWGLELVLPVGGKEDQIALRKVGSVTVKTRTAGEWLGKGEAPGVPAADCAITRQGLVADCRVGQGRAILVADADLLDGEYWQGTGIRALWGNDDFGNMAWISTLLRNLRTGRDAAGEIVGDSGKTSAI